MKHFLYHFLQAWYLIWFGVFISSVERQADNLFALVMCVVGFILWVRYVNKEGR
jgi:cbb3-type cytochrome oxidase subunit 3